MGGYALDLRVLSVGVSSKLRRHLQRGTEADGYLAFVACRVTGVPVTRHLLRIVQLNGDHMTLATLDQSKVDTVGRQFNSRSGNARRQAHAQLWPATYLHNTTSSHCCITADVNHDQQLFTICEAAADLFFQCSDLGLKGISASTGIFQVDLG